MPWQETCTVELREQLVTAMMARGASVAALCRRAGVSRKTAYKWLNRYREGGAPAMAELSRARHLQQYAVSDAIADLIVRTRLEHPTWGAKKILPYLVEAHPCVPFPCLSTISAILAKEGLTVSQKTTPRPKGTLPPGGVPSRPNHVWTIDFKGQFRLGCRELCYPLTVVDAFSRFILCVDAKPSVHAQGVFASTRRLFMEYGLPERIKSDNGSPFASAGIARLSRLNVWFLALGIDLERIPPGRPGCNGSHERMHRTLKAEATRPPSMTMLGQQRRFNKFRQEYNDVRPCEAIGQKTPGKLYQSSIRPFMEPTPDDDTYAGHWERRNVKNTGCIKWRGEQLFLSEALSGRTVGLVEQADGVWQISYRKNLIAILDERKTQATIVDALCKQRPVTF